MRTNIGRRRLHLSLPLWSALVTLVLYGSSNPIATTPYNAHLSSPANTPQTVFTRVGELTFLDAEHGLARGARCPETGPLSSCAYLWWATVDGGSTWRTLPISLPRTPNRTVDLFIAPGLSMATVRDWFVLDAGIVLATHNGGRTWQQERRIGVVEQLLALTGRILAVSSPYSGDMHCPRRLFLSPNEGRTWRLVSTRLPPDSSLLRAGNHDALLLSDRLASGDEGRTWHALANPCPAHGPYPYGESMAALDVKRLWQLCGGEPGAGEQAKFLYASDDGGRQWRPLASAHWNDHTRFPGTLPISGYIGSIARTTPTRGWLVLQRQTLWATRDGGYRWYPAIPYGEANPGDPGIGPLAFVDAAHVWLGAQGRVYRTVDGGAHWTAATLP